MDSRRLTRIGFFPLVIWVATLTWAWMALPTNVVAQSEVAQSLTPELQQRRTQLLQRLKIATYLLEQEDYDRAARHFVMPPGAEPSMLESLIRNRETSQAGVKRLEEEATFGPATEIFTTERAIAFAKKPGVPVEECFGFNHKTDQGAGEVLAVWRDGNPKIIRLDDVGKIGLPDAWPSAEFQGKPDQATLIRTLETAFTLIDGFQFDAASKLFVIPEDGDPAELFDLIVNDEISPAGIELLNQKAAFGSAADAVGQDRAKILADRVGVDPAECYGMSLETTQDTGEVLAHWNGTRFRIFRLNNLAKMVPQQATDIEPDDGAKLSPDQMQAAASDADADAPPTAADDDSRTPKAADGMPTREQFLALLPKLEQAVADDPENLKANLSYAVAQNYLENYSAAWPKALAAYQLAPENQQAVLTLDHTFQKLEELGVFTVGVPLDTIESLLGKPTNDVMEGADFLRLVYGFKAIDLKNDRVYRTIDLRGAAEAHFETDELIQPPVPLGWVCKQRKIDDAISTVIFMPAGETPDQWQRQFEVQRFPNLASRIDPNQMANQMENQLKQNFPNSKTTRLETSDDSVLAAVVFELEPGVRWYQLVRFVTGRDDMHRISVTLKEQPTEDDIESWSAILKASKVQLNDE